ncbi:pyrroline-5-carboxylate reductase [Lagierella sp.]|uniref:pyrroline-5-carboxylate reductase n=1 Tax=Lagierella sp. TaxID=2849657 RepID=UPI0026314E75|nr:pyrroline-5-carboxylate reductase [Lagierella sp.]
MYKLGFIGFGNMGKAMALGALKSGYSKEDMAFSKVCNIEETQNEFGIKGFKSNVEVARNSEIVILATKPYQYVKVIEEIKNEIGDFTILMPITPSFSTVDIQELIGWKVKVARIMPNTPALVNCGITGLCFSGNFEEMERQKVFDFVKSFGEVLEIEENLMGGVSAVSGSGPAYVYMLIEAMADMAVSTGIKRKDAYNLVAKTVEGSAKMVLETKKHPGELKDEVCSPKGSTIEGVMELEENGFRGSIIKGLKKTLDRFNEMNEEK